MAGTSARSFTTPTETRVHDHAGNDGQHRRRVSRLRHRAPIRGEASPKVGALRGGVEDALAKIRRRLHGGNLP
ncbi:MAG: hypothetical protein M5R36_25520 [Deltaproteobacteria bacterium]|nr:hypothetical protein [Deltaproteobacteria bacterium]